MWRVVNKVTKCLIYNNVICFAQCYFKLRGVGNVLGCVSPTVVNKDCATISRLGPVGVCILGTGYVAVYLGHRICCSISWAQDMLQCILGTGYVAARLSL